MGGDVTVSAGILLTAILGSGVVSLLVGLFVFVLLPIVLPKLGKFANPQTLGAVEMGIEKLQMIKSAVDTDPNKEDLVEKILKYSEFAVHAAGQVSECGNDAAKKKEYAKKMVNDLLLAHKKQTSADANISALETNIIDGLIETVVAVQKKQASVKAEPAK